MQCTHCSKWHDRGTTTLPNACDKCLKHIEIIEIIPTKEQLEENYKNIIRTCKDRIRKNEEEIAIDKEQMEWAFKQVNEL
jgi:hypothetical protein